MRGNHLGHLWVIKGDLSDRQGDKSEKYSFQPNHALPPSCNMRVNPVKAQKTPHNVRGQDDFVNDCALQPVY